MSGGVALVRYDAACRALAEARAIDDVLDIRAKGQGLAAYARQAKNRQLEIDAAEIRFRAERRIGELMAAQRDGEGMARPGPVPQREPDASEIGSPPDPIPRPPTLAEAGIDKHLADKARRYAAIPADEFDRLLAGRREAVEREDVRVTASLLDAGAQALEKTRAKQERRAEREAELAGRIRALPDLRFGVVLDDPEWRFEVWSRESGLDRAAENHYPTSELAAIAARDIGSIAAPDCAWFRWVTVPFLAHGIRLMEQVEGFTYKTSWIWAKDRIGTGYWNRNRHEVLLLATRGDVPCPAPGTQWDSLLEAAVGAHSAKPEDFLEMIEDYFPTLPKIELNRRGPPRPGWDAWGNEVEAIDALHDSRKETGHDDDGDDRDPRLAGGDHLRGRAAGRHHGDEGEDGAQQPSDRASSRHPCGHDHGAPAASLVGDVDLRLTRGVEAA